MSEDGYNGWSNYPTWNVALWVNNDQGLQELVFEFLREDEDVDEVGPDEFGEYVGSLLLPEEMPEAGPVADVWGWAWAQVDWHELLEAFREDSKEEE